MLQSKQQIGKLDRRITFQQKIVAVNASNEDEEAGWEDIDATPNVWCNVDEKSGSESYRAEKLTAVTVAVFTVRHRTDLNEEMRILYNSRIYGIQAIIFDTRKGFLKITAESGGEYVESLGEFEFTTEFTTELNA